MAKQKNITIKTFPLFKFGEALLLCPAKYANLDMNNIAKVSKYCFATTNPDMTQAPPTHSEQIVYLKKTYCDRAFTIPPLIISYKQQCVFAPSKTNPNAT